MRFSQLGRAVYHPRAFLQKTCRGQPPGPIRIDYNPFMHCERKIRCPLHISDTKVRKWSGPESTVIQPNPTVIVFHVYAAGVPLGLWAVT